MLNDRERRIFETRRLAEDPITLAELAEEFSVSTERVRQIEVSALEKVQNAVKHRVAAMERAPRRCQPISATLPGWPDSKQQCEQLREPRMIHVS